MVRVESLAADLRSTGSVAETVVADADPDAIADISSSLRVSRITAQNLSDDLWPLRWAEKVVGRIPIIGDNLNGALDLSERLNHDLEAVVALVMVADLLATVYDDLPNSDAGLLATLNGLPSESEVVGALQLIDDADSALTRSDVKASSMDRQNLSGIISDKSEELRLQEVRLREILEWTGLATESLLALLRLTEMSLPLAGLLDGDNPSATTLGRDAFSAMGDLEKVATDAYLTVGSTNDGTPSGIAGSRTGNILLDLEPILGSLVGLSRAGGLTWTAVSPAFDAMESSQGGLVGEGTSILSALELLKKGQPEFREARGILDSIGPQLRSANLTTPTAITSARTLSDISDELAGAVGFLSDFPEIGTQALGKDGLKRYLVLGQTSDELRGSGGYVSGAWTITFENGQMSDFEYHDVVDIDIGTSLKSHPAPPELLAQHMDAPVWLLRDSMWSPEFPAAARTAAEIFSLSEGGSNVDGVIALTQGAIIQLVEALGTIDIASGSIDSADLLPAIEAGTDAEGRAFVDTVFRVVLDKLRSPDVNDRLFNLARAAAEMLDRKDAQVYMVDTGLQGIIASSGWDGSIEIQDGDRIAVIDSNVGWNKVDRNIERSFKYHVKIQPAGPMQARVELMYHNTSDVDDDDNSCDVQAPLHGLTLLFQRVPLSWMVIISLIGFRLSHRRAHLVGALTSSSNYRLATNMLEVLMNRHLLEKLLLSCPCGLNLTQ